MPPRKEELFNYFTYLCSEAEFLYHLKQTQASPSQNDCSSFFDILHLKIILCYFQN